MADDDGQSSDRKERLPSVPEGYVRRQTIFTTIGAAVGILGSVLGLLGLNNAYRDYVDRLITNERNERINADNKIEIRVDGCCRRH